MFSRQTDTRLTAPCLGLPRSAGTGKVKPIWILLKQETVSGSGISWAICKSVPCSRQITSPAPHHWVFYRLDALPAAQPTASKHWRLSVFKCLGKIQFPMLVPVHEIKLISSTRHWYSSMIDCRFDNRKLRADRHTLPPASNLATVVNPQLESSNSIKGWVYLGTRDYRNTVLQLQFATCISKSLFFNLFYHIPQIFLSRWCPHDWNFAELLNPCTFSHLLWFFPQHLLK